MTSKLIARNNVTTLFAVFFIIIVMLQISINDIAYRFLSLINAVLTVLFIFSYSKRSYSLHKIVNIFLLFFFVIANAIQFSKDTITSSIPIKLVSEDYVYFQIIVFLIILIFNIAYGQFDKMKFKELSIKSIAYSPKRLIILSLLSLMIMLWLYRNNLLYFFVRGVAEDLQNGASGGGEETQGNVGYMFLEKVVRAIPFSCAIIAINFSIPKKLRFILLFIMLIALFPPGLSRNATAMYWLPILLIICKRLDKGNLFVFVMLLALLVVFPLLGIFRKWDGTFDFGYSLDYLNTMNFDASQEFMIIIKKNVITMGGQLLGAIFFFIPRSIWPDKPIGSGAFVAEKEGVFSNISMPYFGEGYINFGYVGVVVFSFFLAYLCSRLDKDYWRKSKVYNRFKPYYLLFLSSILFIMRGDLMSSIAYTTGTAISIYMTERIVQIQK